MPWHRLKATVVQTHTQQTHGGEVGGTWSGEKNYDFDVFQEKKMRKRKKMKELGWRIVGNRHTTFNFLWGQKKKVRGEHDSKTTRSEPVNHALDAIYWLGMLVRKALYQTSGGSISFQLVDQVALTVKDNPFSPPLEALMAGPTTSIGSSEMKRKWGNPKVSTAMYTSIHIE